MNVFILFSSVTKGALWCQSHPRKNSHTKNSFGEIISQTQRRMRNGIERNEHKRKAKKKKLSAWDVTNLVATHFSLRNCVCILQQSNVQKWKKKKKKCLKNIHKMKLNGIDRHPESFYASEHDIQGAKEKKKKKRKQTRRETQRSMLSKWLQEVEIIIYQLQHKCYSERLNESSHVWPSALVA